MTEDDFKDPLAKYKEITSQTTKSNPETMGRYHTNWLNMMYPRLRLAANLLRDDGVIFISIDDNEVTNLRKLCDEVFGEENFIAQFPWRKRTAKSDVPFGVSQDYEWILSYAKTNSFAACIEGGTRKYFETDDLPGRPWRIHDLTSQRNASERPNSYFSMVDPKTGKEYPCNPNRTWAITKETFSDYYQQKRIVFPDDYAFLNITKPAFRYFKEDDIAKAGDKFGFISVSTKLPDNIGMTQDGTKEIDDLFNQKIFGFPKPLEFIKFFVKISTATSNNEKDIILDFFSGSATTAHAVMQLNAEDGGNRQFIMVQLPELTDEKSEAYKAGYKNICEIGKERIRRAGAKIRAEHTKVDTGFKVFKLDTSNLVKWDDTPILDNNTQDLFTRMNNMVESIKTDRTELDVVYEVMLKLGIPVTYKIFETQVNDRKVYSIGEDGLVLVCLDKSNGGITPEDITAMCDLAPAKIVAAENAFKDDVALSNAYYISKDKGIEIELL